jgi:hypothetical protein
MTDGLLNDCMDIQIIATFNTNAKMIDRALTRAGRLQENYKFKKLSKSNANKLAKFLGIDDSVIHKKSPFYFTHMKPALQGWEPTPGSWLTQTLVHFTDNKELFLNNIKQTGIFHYVEDEFLTNNIIEKLNV